MNQMRVVTSDIYKIAKKVRIKLNSTNQFIEMFKNRKTVFRC